MALYRRRHMSAISPSIVSGVSPPKPPGTIPPALASAAGFNTKVIFDDFDSISTIDVNNTLAAGFKWYKNSPVVGGNIIAANAMSVSNSILTINDTAGGYLCSAGFLGFTPPTSVGTLVSPGGYYGVRMKLSNANPPAPDPGMWMFDWKGWVDKRNSVAYHMGELDIQDIYGALPHGAIVDHSGTTIANDTIYVNTNFQGGTLDTNWVIWEMVWKTMAMNGGIGSIKWYTNGTHNTSMDVTYTATGISPEAPAGAPTGVFSIADTSPEGYSVMFGTGANVSTDFDWVQVWQ